GLSATLSAHPVVHILSERGQDKWPTVFGGHCIPIVFILLAMMLKVIVRNYHTRGVRIDCFESEMDNTCLFGVWFRITHGGNLPPHRQAFSRVYVYYGAPVTAESIRADFTA